MDRIKCKIFVSAHENTVGISNVSFRNSECTGPKRRTVCTMCRFLTKHSTLRKTKGETVGVEILVFITLEEMDV